MVKRMVVIRRWLAGGAENLKSLTLSSAKMIYDPPTPLTPPPGSGDLQIPLSAVFSKIRNRNVPIVEIISTIHILGYGDISLFYADYFKHFNSYETGPIVVKHIKVDFYLNLLPWYES